MMKEEAVLDPNRPRLNMLSKSLVDQIISEAFDVLEKTGVLVENEDAVNLLKAAGCKTADRTVYMKPSVVEAALKTVVSSIDVFDRHEEPAMQLKGDHIHFDPGSAALLILDSKTGLEREPETTDLVQFVRVTDALPYYAAQSTGLISADVPKAMQDRYRLYIGLRYSAKPVVTGTFSVESFDIMKEMLVAVRGNEDALRKKPPAIFDCCPSPPLKWSHLTCQNLIDAARSSIPAELVSMPLTGATSPVTLTGALVQLTAENLSGITIHQLAGPGAPIIFGGSPSGFDMRTGTTPMGAIETMMIDASYAQIGKTLGLPVHAYMGLSDAKIVDTQSGLEAGIGAVLAALAGVNVISGPGMLNFESCQSLEKLLIDHEICGMAHRLVRGVEPRSDQLAPDLYGDIYDGEHFVGSEETLQWFREELFAPGKVIDRDTYEIWKSKGRKSTWERAKEGVDHLLRSHREEKPLPDDVRKELDAIAARDARSLGLESLPPLPEIVSE